MHIWVYLLTFFALFQFLSMDAPLAMAESQSKAWAIGLHGGAGRRRC